MRPELPEVRFMRVLNLIEMLNPDRIIGEFGKRDLEGFGLGLKFKEFCTIWRELKRDAQTRGEQLKKMLQK